MKRKRSAKIIWGRLIVFFTAALICSALMLGLIAVYVFGSAALHGFSFDDEYTFKIGMESTELKRMKRLTYEMGDVGDETVLYLNFSVLQNYTSFYESGDGKEYRYILPSDHTSFTVTNGSTRVMIGENCIYMEAPAIHTADGMYLPLSFIDEYINGITVENAVTEEKSEDSDEIKKTVDEYTFIIRCDDEGDYSLRLCDHVPCDPIDRSALD